MRRTARLTVIAAGLAALGLAAPASAASGPTSLVFTDKAGDSQAAPLSAVTGTGDDLTQVTLTTTGVTTSKKLGKKVVKTYTPKLLTITLQLSAAVDTSGKVNYTFEGKADCGNFYLAVSPGSRQDSFGTSCSASATASADIADAAYVVKGNTLTFSVPVKTDGFGVGKTLSSLKAYTGSVDPVTGTGGPAGMFGSTPLDNDDATTDASYKIG